MSPECNPRGVSAATVVQVALSLLHDCTVHVQGLLFVSIKDAQHACDSLNRLSKILLKKIKQLCYKAPRGQRLPKFH